MASHSETGEHQQIVTRNQGRAAEFMLHFLRADLPALQRVLAEATATPVETAFFVQSLASIARAPLLRLLGQERAEKLLEDAMEAMAPPTRGGPAEGGPAKDGPAEGGPTQGGPAKDGPAEDRPPEPTPS